MKKAVPKIECSPFDTRIKKLPEFGDLRPQTSGDLRHILRKFTTLLSLILIYKDFTTGNPSNGKVPKIFISGAIKIGSLCKVERIMRRIER